MILMAHSKATPEDISKMLEFLKDYIKVAVYVRKEILAGGGVMHADCEAKLLESGSQQKDIWGADWRPDEKKVDFRSLINIRPRQGNRSMEIQDHALREQVEKIVRGFLEI